MEERREQLVALAMEHGPCSVRHVFYRAVVTGVPGITKTEAGYNKVQRAVLELRRANRIPYTLIVDNTRWMRRTPAFGSIADAINRTAELYRRDLWEHSAYRVEVWCESDSIAGTVFDIVNNWTLPTMVTRGYSSETFAYNAAEAWKQDPDQVPVVLYIGDLDPAGVDIETTLRDRLERFYGDEVWWSRIGVTAEQVIDYDLPGTAPKREFAWPWAVEAEALPPNVLRGLLHDTIASYVDQDVLDRVLLAEEAERESLARIVGVLR